MQAGELCTRVVITADPDESVVSAARRMAREGVGDLIVVEDIGGKVHPIGIVTDRDLVTGALVLGDDRALTQCLRDVMQAELVTAYDDESVEAVLGKLKRRHVRRIPIVDRQGALQGVLTLDDIVAWIREQIDDAAAVLDAPPRLAPV